VRHVTHNVFRIVLNANGKLLATIMFIQVAITQPNGRIIVKRVTIIDFTRKSVCSVLARHDLVIGNPSHNVPPSGGLLAITPFNGHWYVLVDQIKKLFNTFGLLMV
jgi:hypothetical protein